jgi:hypothetical protein
LDYPQPYRRWHASPALKTLDLSGLGVGSETINLDDLISTALDDSAAFR